MKQKKQQKQTFNNQLPFIYMIILTLIMGLSGVGGGREGHAYKNHYQNVVQAGRWRPDADKGWHAPDLEEPSSWRLHLHHRLFLQGLKEKGDNDVHTLGRTGIREQLLENLSQNPPRKPANFYGNPVKLYATNGKVYKNKNQKKTL